MDTALIARMIKEELPDAVINIEDVRGDGMHFSATVSSGTFEGLTRIQQHRRVHKALESVIGNALHALQLTTKVL